MAAAIALYGSSASAETATWFSATSGNWTDPTKWSPAVSPIGNQFDVFITAVGNPSGYVVDLSTSVNVNTLTIDSPEADLVQTAGDFSVVGALAIQRGFYSWRDGSINAGSFVVGTGGRLHMSDYSVKTVNGTWDNHGTIYFITDTNGQPGATGDLSFAPGAVLNNNTGALFEHVNTTAVTGTGTINNAGTWNYYPNLGGTYGAGVNVNNALGGVFDDFGSGTLRMLGAFNNAGTVVLRSGTMEFSSGTSSGTFNAQTFSETQVGVASFVGDYTFNSGTAFTGTGRVEFSNGTKQVNGNVSLGQATLISGSLVFDAAATAESLTNTGGMIDLGGSSLAVGETIITGGTTAIGVASGPLVARGATGSGSLSTEILTVSGGTTNVNPGAVLSIGSEGLSMGGTNSPTITLFAHVSTPGKLLLGGNLASQNTSGTAAISNSGPVPIAGTIDLSNAVRTFFVNNGTADTDLLVTGRVTNGGITKDGFGTLKLTSPNTYAMGTEIKLGAVEVTDIAGLGIGGVKISNGLDRTLRLRSDANLATFGNDLTLNNGTVEIDRINTGPGLVAGTIQLGRLSVISTDATGRMKTTGGSGGTLEFTGPVTLGTKMIVQAEVDTTLSGAIAGAFAVSKQDGAAYLTFAGGTANTYTGITRVQTGILQLAKTGGAVAVPGNLEAFTGGSVKWLGDDQVADHATLTINRSDSSMNLNGFDDTVGGVSMRGGTLATGSGTLRINGDLTILESTQTAMLTGNLSLGSDVTFNVENGAAATDLLVAAAISGTGGLTKGGLGKLAASQVKVVGPLAVGGGTLEIATNGTASGMLESTSLTVDGGAILAMNDNDFIVNYGVSDPSPEFTLRDYIEAFADNPAATSGISFTPGAGDVTIAVAEKTEWGFGTFNGVTLDDTTVIGKYTYYGDSNLDGAVTSDDYVAVDVGLGTGDSWVQGDFNFSGSVTSDDYVAIDVNLGKGTPTPLAWAELKSEMVALHTEMFGAAYVEKLAYAEANGFGATLVPEPGAAVGALLAAASLLTRRRR